MKDVLPVTATAKALWVFGLLLVVTLVILLASFGDRDPEPKGPPVCRREQHPDTDNCVFHSHLDLYCEGDGWKITPGGHCVVWSHGGAEYGERRISPTGEPARAPGWELP